MNFFKRSSIAISLASLLVITGAGANLANTNGIRVVSADECADIRGGECITLTVLYVTSAVCTIGTTGWLIMEESWDKPEAGNQRGGVNTYPTQIRQATQNTGYSCETVQEFEEVFEGYLE